MKCPSGGSCSGCDQAWRKYVCEDKDLIVTICRGRSFNETDLMRSMEPMDRNCIYCKKGLEGKTSVETTGRLSLRAQDCRKTDADSKRNCNTPLHSIVSGERKNCTDLEVARLCKSEGLTWVSVWP